MYRVWACELDCYDHRGVANNVFWLYQGAICRGHGKRKLEVKSRAKSWRTLYAAGEFTFCFDDKGEALVLSREVP